STLLFRNGDYRRRRSPHQDHFRARTSLHTRRRSTVSGFAPQEIRHRHRPVGLVRLEAHALTRPLENLRHDLLAMARAGIAAVDAGRLVETAVASRAIPARAVRLIAAGKAAVPMAAAAARALGDRVRQGLIVGVLPAGTSTT